MASSLPRILHALAPGAAGGLESVVRAHATGWAARGGVVGVALMLDQGAELPAPFRGLEEAGVRVFCHPLPHRAYLQERARFREDIVAFRPEVVHCHGYRADLLAGAAAAAAGVPRCSTVHGFTGGDWKNRLYEWLQLRAFRRFDAVLAVSEPIVGRLAARGVPRERIHLVPNAWAPAGTPLARAEARSRLGLPPDRPLLGWVGRLSREKGADIFLEALARTALEAVVVGDGAEAPALRAEAGRLGLTERVHWTGLVREAGRCFAAFDVFVMSSRTEGTPIALFEAMAARVPVVTTAVGGIPDVVTPAEAVLVPPEDPGALAAALQAVLADPAGARARAAHAAERLATRYAPGPWLDRHAELYRAMVARRS